MSADAVLDTACRAWVPEPAGLDRRWRRRPHYLVVLDTETRLDVAQHLLVGAWRYVRVSWEGRRPIFSVAQEGLIVPDDASQEDWRLVRAYAASHLADVDPGADGASTVLALKTRAEFCEDVLWEACWRNRAWLVGFNLAFDLGRLALSWTEGRGRRKGAFVLRLWEHGGADNRYRPNVYVGRLDGRRHLFAWGGVEDAPVDTGKRSSRDDHFLDLATLALALTNGRHSLESACEAFAVPYAKRAVELGTLSADLVDYCREDVAATTELARAMLGAFYAHPVPFDADGAYSPASIGLGYFARMGLRPPRAGTSALTDEQLAQVQAAFFGQRMEARIRHVPVPVVLLDFSSQYPVVAHLMRLWGLLTAERILAEEATEPVRELLERITADDVFVPASWAELSGFALVEPKGDWLPRRAYFSGSADVPRASLGPTWGRSSWWALPDLVAAKLTTGKTLKVLSAWRLVGQGRQPLRRVRLGGKLTFDPAVEDWWLALVNARRRLSPDDQLAQGLKTAANGTAYGCWERHDRQEHAGEVASVRPDGRRTAWRVEHPERPHRWTYPPFASLVTAGGRLLMASLERLLSQEGGCWASANTDSAAVVATKAGGLVYCPGGPWRTADGAEAVRALSWVQVDQVRQRFEGLNPLAGRDLLKLEDENFRTDGARRQLWALAVSGGRLLIYARDGNRPMVVKRNEHNLGELRSPSGNGREFLDEFALWALGHLSGGEARAPEWWAWPATYNFTASTPARLRQIGGLGAPFGFLMASQVLQAASIVGHEGGRVVAPLGPPEAAASAPWANAKTGTPVTVLDEAGLRADLESYGAEQNYGPNEVTLRTYGQALREWLNHPETKMTGPDGQPCGRRTRGLLQPRGVIEGSRHYVGKESNLADEVEASDVTDPGEVLTDFGDDSWAALLVPVLRAMGCSEAERRSGVRRERVAQLLSQGSTPRKDAFVRLMAGASGWAAEQLTARSLCPPQPAVQATSAPQSRLASLAAYLAAAPEHSVCKCGCGTALPPMVRRKFVNDTHRKRAARAAQDRWPNRPALQTKEKERGQMSDLSPSIAERAELIRYEPWLETSLLWQTAKGLAEPTNNACPDALRGKTGAIFQQLLMGKELGLPPVQALTRLYIVRGKVGISATMMRALVRRAGHRISTVEKTDGRCTLEGERHDTGEKESVTWTIQDAERAGLLKDKEGAAWQTYPRRMLFARATSELCDSLFPDVLVGFSYTPEELGSDPAEEDLLEAEREEVVE